MFVLTGAYTGLRPGELKALRTNRLDLRVFRRRFWNPAMRESVGEPMRPHDLRHTHVALLIAAGETPTPSRNDSGTPRSTPPTTSTGT